MSLVMRQGTIVGYDPESFHEHLVNGDLFNVHLQEHDGTPFTDVFRLDILFTLEWHIRAKIFGVVPDKTVSGAQILEFDPNAKIMNFHSNLVKPDPALMYDQYAIYVRPAVGDMVAYHWNYGIQKGGIIKLGTPRTPLPMELPRVGEMPVYLPNLIDSVIPPATISPTSAPEPEFDKLIELSKAELANLYQQLHAASKGLPMPQAGAISPEDHKTAMQLFDLTNSARLLAVLIHENKVYGKHKPDRIAIREFLEAVKATGILDGVI